MSPTISAASKSNATASRKNILRERNDASQPDFSNTHVEKLQSPNLQTPKKPLTKNSTSPIISISAVSKRMAIASRKNILGERMEASEPDFWNTHVEKSHKAIDNVSHSLSQALPKSPPSFQSHDADEALSNDLASRPYDPVTNYLSPRPQFLRYKPNRRQELFLGLENGVGFRTSTSGSFDYQKATGEEVGAVTSPSSLASPRPDGSLTQEDEVELSDSGSFDYQKATDEEVGAVTSPGSLALPHLDGSLKQEDEEIELSDSGSFDYQKATDEEVGAVTSPGSLALPHLDGSLKQEDEEIELSDSGSFDYQKATDEEVGAVTSPGSLALPHLDGSLKQEDEEIELSDSGSFDYQKATDEEVGAVTSPGSLASPRPDGTLKQEDEGIELSDEDIEASDAEVEGCDEESDEEEYEEVEEEKGGKLKGVLKSLLLLLAIVLFASYMSPMNHQTHFEGMDDAYCSTQNSTIEAALLKKLESRGNLSDQKEERHTGFVEVIKGAIEMGTEEVMVQGEEMQIDEDIEDEAKVEDENLGDVELADEMREVVKPQAEEIEEEKEGGIHGLGEVVVMPQLEDIEDISGDIVEKSELQGVGPSMSDDFDHQNLVSDVSNAFEKGEVAAEQNDGIVEKIMEMAAEPVIPETMDNDDISFDEASDLKAEGNWREELINFMKSKTFYAAAIGVSVFSVIVASLVSVFRFKQRNATKRDSRVMASPSAKPLVIEQKKINGNISSPPSKPYYEPLTAERYNLAFPGREDDSIEHVYSSFRRMSLSSKHSTRAASGEYFHSKAPTVELLSELVVGEVSSSLRTCDMKNKMTESEENNYSVSSKKLGSKDQSISIQVQPSESEFSSMDSHSYGSFSTPQMAMKKKKEGGNDGEITTPLRRSSRLRNRTVTSP
ncbi:hypothetical protein C1H46_022361 [Malus baccata]|uniref:Uncharacterized protein n=1 Tax=Malus baccata TaxID=106549 RepID=A0A540M045_MALBA|nr:hypothetical protein C1H46_022361 [Malus baccata]